jgi:hypothetical protein
MLSPSSKLGRPASVERVGPLVWHRSVAVHLAWKARARVSSVLTIEARVTVALLRTHCTRLITSTTFLSVGIDISTP